MNYFVPVFAYLSPVLLGLIVAFLVATSEFTRQGVKSIGKMLLYYLTIPVLAVMIVIGLVPSPASFNISFINLLCLAVFFWGWLIMVAGVSYLFIRAGLNKNIAYIIVSLLILLTNATVFYINPFISAWQDNPGLRQWIIGLAVKINPMLTVAGNFFGHDLLRARAMYSLCDIGPYYFYSYANWFTLWIIYVIIGAVMIGLALIKKNINTNKTNTANKTN
ncbi:MAG: hypothetical protein HZA49_06245 [Planctomycetes bacterium]|nr:hypothetical protein [Planctomycetota bacterium]